jgi:CRISPR-associated endonuclease/helicase Cas3
MYVELFAQKLNLSKLALLTDLVHDLGKNCTSWATYLEESHKFGKRDKKEDHGTAGGQYLYEIISKKSQSGSELIAQLLAACVMYHHGKGLPDVIELDGTAQLCERLMKSKDETHEEETITNLNHTIKQKLDVILTDDNFISETMEMLRNIVKSRIPQAGRFNLGLTARFLSSCLIDGDRRSSALFDRNIPVRKEDAVIKANWMELLERLEKHLNGFPSDGKLNKIRHDVSERCAEFAKRESGMYTLTAATGAGKTLASLRYALAHAEYTGKDHIFIIAPYTSILDQNADVIRSILDPEGKNGQLILEHHSNLGQGEKTEQFIDSSETWNVPIIITTMVQFLKTLFGAGTRKIRRMHQLANSVIIFDEIQTLPLSCTYLFTWAIKYFCQSANVSILLTTATQPGLDKLKSEYALPLLADNEIIPNIATHFEDLKRVELVDGTTAKGHTLDAVAEFIESLNENSILIVVNTKSQAQILFQNLTSKHPDRYIVHLSTNMCPAHRRQDISQLKEELKDKYQKCICISTRLIEAGVDIDFNGAIRFLAGFDSLIQTAGRCNRNGNLKDSQGNFINGKTWIVNIVKDEEAISSLPELMRGQEIMERILREFHSEVEKYKNNLLHPDLIVRYFYYYYGQMPDSLLKHKIKGMDETVLDLLSDNSKSEFAYNSSAKQKYGENVKPLTDFRQSFETAWKAFEVIAEDTVGVIVPFEDGKRIIGELFALPDIKCCAALLQEAQQYSINVYYNKINDFIKEGRIKKLLLDNDLEIYILNEEYYDNNIGLTDKEGRMSFCNA